MSQPAVNSEDYELLLPNTTPTMGQEEQIPKPEGRKGDKSAYYVALVRRSSALLGCWLTLQ